MPIEFPTLNFAALAPVLIIFAGAFVVMFLELYIRDKRILGYLSLVGLAATAIASFLLFNRAAVPAYQSMLVSDGYALILNLIFIVAAALSILIAISYLGDRGLQRGEYYALILFSGGGMMLMAGATDLIVVFMGLEIMSIALYVLAAFNRQQMGSGEAGAGNTLCWGRLLRPFSCTGWRWCTALPAPPISTKLACGTGPAPPT